LARFPSVLGNSKPENALIVKHDAESLAIQVGHFRESPSLGILMQTKVDPCP
jgi:hypothetical protein